MKNGIYVVGDRSWSIDMQRYNFQFTGQRFYKITDGKLAGQSGAVSHGCPSALFRDVRILNTAFLAADRVTIAHATLGSWPI